MSYGGFLALFLVAPISLLILVQWSSLTKRRWVHLLVLMAVAAVYTTPWDNYLVANRVWWYDPNKVSGLVLGYVPLEEYLFFLLQPLLTGLLLLYRRDRRRRPSEAPRNRLRWRRLTVAVTSVPWLLSIYLLMAGPPAARYLSLQLAWALPPLMLQFGFGADLLRENWRSILVTLLLSTSYLVAADIWAISRGIWTIDPGQTLGWNPMPALVFEEALFFLLTNSLVIGGLTLLQDERSMDRLRRWLGAVGVEVASAG